MDTKSTENENLTIDNKFYKVAISKSHRDKKSALNLLDSKKENQRKFESFNEFTNYKKIYIFFYKISEINDEKMIKIDIELDEKESFENATEQILIKFNERFENEMIPHHFQIKKNTNIQFFSCSKAGKIKTHIPSIEKNQIISLTGMKVFAITEAKTNKNSLSKNPDLFSLESKETGLVGESLENDHFLCNFRNESISIAKKTYSNSLINLKGSNGNITEETKSCLSYCKFSFCK